MKKMISSVISPDQRFLSFGLFLIRVLVGVAMLTHGIAKLTSFSGLASTFPDPIGLGSTLSLILIICAEVGCSVLVIVGAFTRLAVLPLMFSMLVIIFMVHGDDPFQAKELPLLYLGIYVLLFFSGAGRISLDTIISRKINVDIAKG